MALSASTQYGQYGPTFPVESASMVDYGSAGHFVRWLLEVHGPGALVSYLSAVGGVEEFEEFYEQSLADMTAEFFATAAPDYPALYNYPTPAFEVLGDALWSSALEYSCDRDDVRGTEDGRMAVRELTIPKTGFYAFWTSTGGAIHGRNKSVTSDEDASEVFGDRFELPPGVIAAGPVNAGVYEIGVIAPPGVESGVVMVWESLTSEPVFPGGVP